MSRADESAAPSRRAVLVTGAAGVAAGASALAWHARSAPPLTPRGPVEVGFTVVTSRGTTVLPDAEVARDLDLCRSLGAGVVRLGCPLFLVGGVFGHRFEVAPTLDRLARHVRAAHDRDLGVWLTLTAPVGDPKRPGDLSHHLEMNRQAMLAVAEAMPGPLAGVQVLNEWNLGHYRTHTRLVEPLSESYLAEVGRFLRMAVETLREPFPRALMTSALGGFPVPPQRWSEWEGHYRRAGSALDAWGVNLYLDPGAPEGWSDHVAALARFRDRAQRPVVVTETGLSSGRRGGAGDGGAAGAVARMCAALAGAQPATVLVYQLRDLRSGSASAEDTFGVVTTQGEPKGDLDGLRRRVLALRGHGG